MNLRIAHSDDLSAIVEMYNQAISVGHKTVDVTPFAQHERVKWFEEHLPEKRPILVAEINNAIVGYLAISAYRPGRMELSQTAEVSIYIHFKFHRQGIASRLMQYAIDICLSLELKSLIAIILDDNEGSISFLKKSGFNKWGHLPKIAEFDDIQVGHLYYGLRIDQEI